MQNLLKRSIALFAKLTQKVDRTGLHDRAEGKVKFIGFSTHRPPDVIVKTIETNQFDHLNLHWQYINQIDFPGIKAAKRHDMGVFIISASDRGVNLTARCKNW